MSERLEKIEAKIEKAKAAGKNEISIRLFRGELANLLAKGYIINQSGTEFVIHFGKVVRYEDA